MIIKAVVENGQHPEYGVATISFPIPQGEYDHTMELLEDLGIGDVLQQDCRVVEVDSRYPIFKRLEHANVNVDELDYLAKRLDSFSKGEDAQFQAAACKLGVCNIKDFIDLTFCCQQVTVITDFSDLERIGRDHLMNLNDGTMAMEEYQALDGRMEALNLILKKQGYVTPYGVIYDNGMKLEQLYAGRHFPSYLYEPPVLAVEAVSAQKGSTGLLCLPMSDRQLQRMRLRAEVDSPDTWLRIEMDELPEKVAEAMDPCLL